MFKKLKVWWLKRQARNTYTQYMRTADEYDCGLSMMDVVSGGRTTALKAKFNGILDKLEKLGEPIPSKRL